MPATRTPLCDQPEARDDPWVQAHASIEIGRWRRTAVICPTADRSGDRQQCSRSGIRNVIVITAGFAEAGHWQRRLERRCWKSPAATTCVLGPNCLGLIRPTLGLTTFAKVTASGQPRPRSIRRHVFGRARLGQRPTGVGSRPLISLGGFADVDFGEILDYLIYDSRTHYILLYVEGIRNARRFMSACVSAARIKPIILLAAKGRHAAGSLAVQTHSGMIAVGQRFRCRRPPCRCRPRQERRPVVLRRQRRSLEIPPAGKAPCHHHQRWRPGRHGGRPCRGSRHPAGS